MSLRKIVKKASSTILIPLTRWYLRKERKYRYKGVIVKVFPGVFHPGLFYSTRFLLSFIEKQNLKNKSFLELGCGSGLISVAAAKQGAEVTSSDLNPRAVENCVQNAELNNIQLTAIHSNLFRSIPQKQFDWIVINPPYYAKAVQNDESLAWNCGENFEYFRDLFLDLKNFMHQQSKVIMVLTLGCDIPTIKTIAKENDFDFQLLEEKAVLFDEKDFIFQIRHSAKI